MTAALHIVVNGAPTTQPAGTVVAALVERNAPSLKGIAVAVNGTIVPRSGWDGSVLFDGDRVEILGAAQGG